MSKYRSNTSMSDDSVAAKVDHHEVVVPAQSELEYGEAIHTKPALINYVAAIFA